jgi:hypothetical protein
MLKAIVVLDAPVIMKMIGADEGSTNVSMQIVI